jgi:predicted DNA-binding mobile mystery protein A
VLNLYVMSTQKLQIEQLNSKLKPFELMAESSRPAIGWVKTIRTSVGMSLEQLGNKLGITRQSVRSIEKRESEGAITIKAMEETAEALDMKFVYAIVPKEGSIQKFIENRAKILATEIVSRASATMELEGQENSPERIRQAIQERTQQIIDEMPKQMWD